MTFPRLKKLWGGFWLFWKWSIGTTEGITIRSVLQQTLKARKRTVVGWLEAGWVVTDSRMTLMTLRQKASKRHVLGGWEGGDENWEGGFAITQRERTRRDRGHHDEREQEFAEINS
jgi:hypothetical protein